MLTNSIFLILGLGGLEIALIGFALLLLFGAKKIPDLARGIGKGIREFKDASKEEVKKDVEPVDKPKSEDVS
jgi:sec-independent protein translocase protein TatA